MRTDPKVAVSPITTVSRGLPRAALFLLTLVGAWLICASALAQSVTGDLIAIPPLKAHVTDLSGTLSAAQQAQLEQQLAAFETARGSQIAILIVPTTQPEVIEQFSIRVAEAWKIGRRKHDDGVLVTVAKNDRKMRIDVGYGLEGAIPDVVAKRIISETMAPKFRQGDFAGGLSAAVTQIETLIGGESLPPPDSSDRVVCRRRRATSNSSSSSPSCSRSSAAACCGRCSVGWSARDCRVDWWVRPPGSSPVRCWSPASGALIAFIFVLALSSGAGRRASHGGGWGGGGWTGGSGGSWGGGSDSWGGGGGTFGGGGASGDW